MAREPSKNRQVGGLSRVADDLCSSGASRPVQQAAFRRAISTACHAVFHALCTACADGLVGWGHRDPVSEVYGVLDPVRRVENSRAPPLPGCHRISPTAADHAPPCLAVTRWEAVAAVAQARDAIEIIAGLRAATRTKLALLLLIAQRSP